jgi:F-type H+-transporting ATPase subunit delta
MLQFAAAVANDDTMQDMIGGAAVDREKLAEMFIKVCADQLDQEGQNLIRLLAENHRLALLPEICAVYEIYRAEAESTIEAEVISAMPVSDAQREQIAESLKKRLGKNVSLKCLIDESLIGGAIIRAGDMVIDGSVQGKLQKLASAMSH